MRKAYIVVGPEASGNRYLVGLLCKSGCIGKSSTQQPFDDDKFGIILPELPLDKIAYCRSFPHGGLWINLNEQINKLRDNDYDITVLVMIRDQSVVESSQVATGHTTSMQQSNINIKKAYSLIVNTLSSSNVNFIFIGYTYLRRPRFRKWLANELNLKFPENDFVDADIKYLTDNEFIFKKIKQREVDVSAREVDVSAREVDVSAREVDVSAREVDVSAREVDVSAREVDVFNREKNVAKKEIDTKL